MTRFEWFSEWETRTFLTNGEALLIAFLATVAAVIVVLFGWPVWPLYLVGVGIGAFVVTLSGRKRPGT